MRNCDDARHLRTQSLVAYLGPRNPTSSEALCILALWPRHCSNDGNRVSPGLKTGDLSQAHESVPQYVKLIALMSRGELESIPEKVHTKNKFRTDQVATTVGQYAPRHEIGHKWPLQAIGPCTYDYQWCVHQKHMIR